MRIKFIFSILLNCTFFVCFAASSNAAEHIIERSEWNALPPNEATANKDQYKDSVTPKYVTIHYTGGWPAKVGKSEAQVARDEQNWHINGVKDNGQPVAYGDIAYHFLVGISGSIYRGRSLTKAAASGTYYHSSSELENAEYDSSGKLGLQSLVAGTAPGNSEPHITISFMIGRKGVDPEMPPKPALESAAKLVAELLVQFDLDPSDVRAHREVANSQCPGDLIYQWLRGDKKNIQGSGQGMQLIRAEFDKLRS